MADRDAERAARCRRYTQALEEKVARLIDESLASLSPARLSYSHARCGFAMNRRLKSDRPDGDPYLNRPNPEGVVDHDVPVLKVERPDGTLSAVVFGYACHNTTLKLKQYHGDYAGHAQAMIEKAHPGATALFVTGCGGDQNGYPRSRPEFSEMHGRSLATAVEAALETVARPLAGPLRMAFGKVALDYQPPPSVDRLMARLATGAEYQPGYAVYEREWDRRRLREFERGRIAKSYSAPVQIVRFGDGLTLVAMPGETVVDYSLRLKRELAGPAAVWVAGYSNDVFAYVPSKRVRLEGGYEAERAMTYSTNPVHPAAFEPSLEARLIGKVHQLLQATDRLPSHSSPDASSSASEVAKLSQEEVLAGWISLFDGKSTFGWTGAQLATDGKQATLEGGRTTTQFADYVLVVDFAQRGTIRLGDEHHDLPAGRVRIEMKSAALGSIELGPKTVVRAMSLLPQHRKSLFNGKSLRDWDRREYADLPASRRATWSVENGAIRAVGGPGAIEYAPRDAQNLFGDFLVQLTVRTRRDKTNGGFFFRNEPGKTMMGYEAQLHNPWYDHARGEHGYTTGGIDDRQQARKAVAVDHEPFLMTVVAQGPHIATWVNGYQVTDWNDVRPPHANPRQGLRLEPGTLQLQAHDPETDIEFQGIWVQKVGSR
jgi:hypothetical protein